MKLTKIRWVNLPPTAFVTSARPMGRPQTLAVSPFFNLPEPSIAHRSTIDPEVVARFRFRSRNSATLELSEQSQNHTSDVDLCSPFCFCHCCQTLSFPSFFNGLLSDVEVVTLNITFKESRFSNHFSSIWQPPKI